MDHGALGNADTSGVGLGSERSDAPATRDISVLRDAVVNVKYPEYGAKGDGVTDDLAAIQGAIDSITGTGAFGDGGDVFMPPGIYAISDQIVVPDGVRLVGSGRMATMIRAGAGFPTSTALVRLGTSADAGGCYGTRVEDLTIRCQAAGGSTIAGSIGVYSTGAQELSGIKRVRVDSYMLYGVQFSQLSTDVFCDHFTVDDLECQPNNDATNTIGFKLDAAYHSVSAGIASRVTIIANAIAALQTAGISITGADPVSASMTIRSLNVENHADGVVIGDRGGASIMQMWMNTAGTNAVHLTNEATSAVTIMGLNKGPCTTTIKNDLTSADITDAQVAFYATDSTSGTFAVSDTDGVRQVLSSVPTVNSAATLTLPANANVVRVLGTTTIDTITASWPGRTVTLIFSDVVSVTGSNVYIAGAFSSTAQDTLTIVAEGANWFEVGRSANA